MTNRVFICRWPGNAKKRKRIPIWRFDSSNADSCAHVPSTGVPTVSSSNSASWSFSVALSEQNGGRERDTEHAQWFAEEVQPYEVKLRAYLRHRFPTIGDVDDIVQETYARLFRERRAGKVFEARSYLFPVARNVAFDIFRRNRTIAIGGLGEMAGLGVLEERPDAAEAASHEQELALLHEAIRLLPERCREIFALRRLQGLSHREIAAKLGISENTVDAQLCNAIFRCRQYFVAHGVRRGRLLNVSELHSNPTA
jgi:RNA polymerase sigma factor (sigma-70 family)